MCVRACMRVHVTYVRACARARVRIYPCVRMSVRACACACVCACVRTCVRVHGTCVYMARAYKWHVRVHGTRVRSCVVRACVRIVFIMCVRANVRLWHNYINCALTFQVNILIIKYKFCVYM